MAHLPGDKYQVLTSAGGYTTLCGTWDSWREAKHQRNEEFISDLSIASAWIMRYNDSLGSAREHYGNTLRRNKHERRRA